MIATREDASEEVSTENTVNRFNLRSLRRFWAIAKLYWLGEDKWKALGLLLVLGVMLVAYTQLSVILNREQGNIFSSLSAQDQQRFWLTIRNFLIVLVIYVPLFAGFRYLRSKLGLYWRRWLTNRYLDQYFNNRAFYNLATSNTSIDNPDQRISEDIKSFTQDSLFFGLVIASSSLQIVAFSNVLWQISRPLVIFLVIYAIFGTLVTVGAFGKVLVRLNFNQLKKEANFRFGLVRIRENAESIAFYRGEEQEKNQARNFFVEVFDNFNWLILWQELNLGLFTYAYGFLPDILPAVIVAPSVFSGEVEVGKIREAQGAFFRVFAALNLIVDRFDFLTKFSAGIDRLYTFEDYLQTPRLAPSNGKASRPQIDVFEDSKLAVRNLTLQTPNYQRTLFQNLSVELEPGQGLLVMGASGCGKSSLLRAIAGLWNSGTGAIIRPQLDEMLFLPQRPYMILGNLRSQLLYPRTEMTLDDHKLYQILEQVNLPDLVDRFGNLDVEKDWDDVLSLGEQQRVAFARLLITQPRYAMLDEATSALDAENEESLYQQLIKTGTTYISVGHRSSLVKYHHLVLKLSEQGQWNLSPGTTDPGTDSANN